MVGDQQQPAHEVRSEFEPLHQRVRVVDGLRERDIEHRTRRAVELKARELRVAHDADDAVGADVLRQVEAEVLIERILLRLEKALDERFVDDGDVLRGLVVGGGEVSAADELRPPDSEGNLR